ncbi:hypothetical protein [Sutcliffiella horikoshii]|uniref:hypothetical protein n=1 Tax=Sutcliffiella horikoshii TaxID=79883 RepID=UPI001CFCB130|nr:hypothetical protein [Sutcliffiella horikoshii]
MRKIGKNEKLEECKLKRKYIWWGSGGIVLALLVSLVFWGSPWGIWTNKQAFEVYLEEKYGKDFVIEDISFDFFNTRKYNAYAYVKDEPNLLFYVGQNRYTGQTEDGYASEVWSFKAKEEVGPIVEKYYPDHFNYGVSLILPETEPKEVIRADYKKHATVEVGVSLDNIQVNSANSETEIERAFLLLQALKEKGVPLHHFGISYENRTLQLQEEEISRIQSAEDLGEYLVLYRK